MDVGKNFVLAAYLLLGVGAVFLLVKVATPPVPAPKLALHNDDPAVDAADRDTASVLRTQVLRLERELVQQTQEAARLRELLREKSTELKARVPEVATADGASSERLDESKLDEQLAALIAGVQNGKAKADARAMSKKSGAAALDQSEVALELIALLEKQHQAELDKMRADIREGDRTLTEFREEMEQEITAILEADQAFHLAATETTIAAGAAAVPGLQRLLSHARPEIREWAAYVLGRLGPVARNAAPDLLRLAADSNEAVRVAAAEAIEAIERDE